MAVGAERDLPSPGEERAWTLRAVLVLQSPRSVFAALRDDSQGAAQARQEPIAVLVALAGISLALATPVARHIADDPNYDGLVIAIWAFLGGAIEGLFLYWSLGLLLYLSARLLGGQGSYRRARHLLGFAAAPLALSLAVYWPVRLGVYGLDYFRSGGSDTGAGENVFSAVGAGFVLWTLALLVVGVRAVHGWSWPRATAATALAAAVPVVLTLPSLV